MLRYRAQHDLPLSWVEPTLHYAAKSGSPLALSPFIDNFDINHKIAGDKTALMVAAENGRFGATRLLIAGGADTTAVSKDYLTARQIAEQSGHEASAEFLRVYDSADWFEFKATESLVESLRRDAKQTEIGEYEALLTTEKFAELRLLRQACPLKSDEVIWFSATGPWAIGIDHSGSIMWGFNNRRVDELWNPTK